MAISCHIPVARALLGRTITIVTIGVTIAIAIIATTVIAWMTIAIWVVVMTSVGI